MLTGIWIGLVVGAILYAISTIFWRIASLFGIHEDGY